MALLDRVTIGEVSAVAVDVDPTVSGIDVPIGSFALLDNQRTPAGKMWMKTGAAIPAWTAIPMLVAGQTALQNNAILYTDPSGAIKNDATKMIWDPTNSRLGIGANAPAVPVAALHHDMGNATAVKHKFTAGTTTGVTTG